MTLQERLRDRAKKTWLKEIPCDEGVFPIMDLVGEAADALDAKDARIKELEGALRDVQPILDDVLLSYHEALRNEWRRKAHAWHDRAREALK